MSSGRKQLRQNTRERVISTDFNRQQAFGYGYANEFLREQILTPVDDEFFAGVTFTSAGSLSFAVSVTAPAAPDAGVVLNGLMVLVPISATSVLITAGALVVIDPEGVAGSSDPTPASPDDGPGPARTVYSAGINTLGTLAWTANPGASVRVDVVECQRTNIVTETDNRDIFNPATGLFTPASVTKVTAGELTFRIRQGIAGSGVPAPALGWFPLAIISAPASSATLDTCYIWDVRNLASDFADGNVNRQNLLAYVDRMQAFVDTRTAPGEARFSGISTVVFAGRRFGGRIIDPVATHPYRNILSATQALEPGFPTTPNRPYYVYAAMPSGYPRWAAYTTTTNAGAGGRVPCGFRGVLVTSQTPPTPGFGTPSIAIGMPSAWGLGAGTYNAVCIGAGLVDSIGVVQSFNASNGSVYNATTGPAVVATIAAPKASVTLTPSVHYPANARSVRLAYALQGTGASALAVVNAFILITLTNATGDEMAFVSTQSNTYTATNAGVINYVGTVDCPLPDYVAMNAPVQSIQFELTPALVYGSTADTLTSGSAAVMGWTL